MAEAISLDYFLNSCYTLQLDCVCKASLSGVEGIVDGFDSAQPDSFSTVNYNKTFSKRLRHFNSSAYFQLYFKIHFRSS